MSDVKTRGPKGRVTIRTVAEDAGVSTAAVSKVLRDAYGVSEGLRQKVEASIERLGYRPSVAARGMRGRTFTIGILLIDLSNPFLSLVVEGTESTLAATRYKALIGVGHGAARVEASLIEQMIDNRADGLLLVAPRTDEAVLADRFARQIPIVAVAHHQADARSFDTVNCDDRLGAALAVRAAVERGHADIGFVTYEDAHEQPSAVALQREKGYLAAMAEAGLSHRARVIRLPGGGWGSTDPATYAPLLDVADRPRAVIVWSDLHAVPLLNFARTRGLRVPEDLSVIGWDNSPVTALPLLDLTSIDQNPAELGRLAAQRLLERIDGRSEPMHDLVRPTLALRSSV